ncbi:MAG TPA: DUF2877 domain-containing protein [Symbiobacteriaceae bacterium]|nr:DUF2877 domain-containing protein [Symbiobacteriaceae bacterium]
MLHATWAAESIGRWLDAPVRGEVHSVFRRVCNLDWGEWLISVHAASTGRLPGGIQVDGAADFSQLGLRPGAPVTWRPDQACLYVGRVPLSLGRAARSTLAATPVAALPAPALLEYRRELLLRWLGSHGRGLLGAQVTKTPADDGGTMQGAAARAAWVRGMSLCDSLLSGTESAIRPGVAALLGLGEGLTPSGDDLILGLMAVFAHGRLALQPSLAACVQRLIECVDDLAPRVTTRISANFLRLGALGEFSERLGGAATALLGASTSSEEVGSTIVRLLESGHSSGTDSAAGLYLGMTVLMAQQQRESVRGFVQ